MWMAFVLESCLHFTFWTLGGANIPWVRDPPRMRIMPRKAHGRLHLNVVLVSPCQIKWLRPPSQISVSVTHSLCSVSPPVTGVRRRGGPRGVGDRHMCSSSSPLPLNWAVESYLLHASCWSLQSSQGFGPANVLKHVINLSVGIWLMPARTGHTASPWPHYEKVSQSFRPTDWILCVLSPNGSWWDWAHWVSRGK